MIANSFLYIIFFCIVSFLLCIVGVVISYFTQGTNVAHELFYSYVFRFDGILIMGFGYGLLFFIRKTGAQAFNALFNLLEIPQEQELFLLRYHKWNTDSKKKHVVSIIVTLIGGTILWNCGYPSWGFAKYFLAATSISLFYVAGQMSGYFISSILIFRKLDEVSLKVKIKKGASPYELENLNLNFLLCSTLGVIALYLSFRGTLTANFTTTENEFVFRKFLVYPIVCFLPGILFVSFYYRYVLRKIQENEIIQKIETYESISKSEITELSSAKEKLEMEKLLMEIKEKLILDRKKIPLLSLKDSPALIVALALMLEFILTRDSISLEFLKEIFK